jgi:hypothetical protein
MRAARGHGSAETALQYPTTPAGWAEIQSDWDQVTSDASDLKGVSMSQLESAWDSFESSVDGVPDDASVSDALSAVASAAKTLGSDVSSTLSGPDCS